MSRSSTPTIHGILLLLGNKKLLFRTATSHWLIPLPRSVVTYLATLAFNRSSWRSKFSIWSAAVSMRRANRQRTKHYHLGTHHTTSKCEPTTLHEGALRQGIYTGLASENRPRYLLCIVEDGLVLPRHLCHPVLQRLLIANDILPPLFAMSLQYRFRKEALPCSSSFQCSHRRPAQTLHSCRVRMESTQHTRGHQPRVGFALPSAAETRGELPRQDHQYTHRKAARQMLGCPA